MDSKNTSNHGKRTLLILRDLPNNISSERILNFFPKMSDSFKIKNHNNNNINNNDKPDKSKNPNEKSENPILKITNDITNVHREDVIKVENVFQNNWTLLFSNEKKCVAAGLYLRDKKVDGLPIHARIENCSVVEKTPIENESYTYKEFSSPEIYSYNVSSHPISSPVFYNQIGNYSQNSYAIHGENMLRQIYVPDGIFGTNYQIAKNQTEPQQFSPLSSISISPNQKRINENFVPPNFYEFSNDKNDKKFEEQFRQMLRINKIEKSKSQKSQKAYFPENMVKSLPKKIVMHFLKKYEKESFEIPIGFLDKDGNPKYFVNQCPKRRIFYGKELPIINPNSPIKVTF